MSKKVQKNLHTEQNTSPLHTSWVTDLMFGKDPYICFSQLDDSDHSTSWSTSLYTPQSSDVKVNYVTLWPTTPFYEEGILFPSGEASSHRARPPFSLFLKVNAKMNQDEMLDAINKAFDTVTNDVLHAIDKVLDTAIGLPLDVFRAGVTATQWGVMAATPVLVGYFVQSTMTDTLLSAATGMIFPIETYAMAAGATLALGFAANSMDYILNDTLLSDYSYFG